MRNETTSVLLVELLFSCPALGRLLPDTHSASEPVGERGANPKQGRLLAFGDKIQTHDRLKRILVYCDATQHANVWGKPLCR